MPKFVVNASGDQYFPPDSSQFYFGDLPGEKYLRYVPNADHSLRDSDAMESIIAFYQTILAGRPRPKYSWTFESDGSIRVKTDDVAQSGHALASDQSAGPRLPREDDRQNLSEPAAEGRGGGVYVGKIDPPAKRLDGVLRRADVRRRPILPAQAVHGGANPARHVAFRRPRPGKRPARRTTCREMKSRAFGAAHSAATKTRLKAAHSKAQAEGLGTVQHPVIPKAQRAATPSFRFSCQKNKFLRICITGDALGLPMLLNWNRSAA